MEPNLMPASGLQSGGTGPTQSAPAIQRTKNSLVIPVVAAAFLVILFAMMAAEVTPGMPSEGTDWAMYVMHARNLVKGLPYTQTGYVFQPESTTEIAATSYPSGFPILLAPFYAVFGPDLKLFKVLNCAFLVLSLWPIYLFARRSLRQISSFLLILSLGLSALYFGSFNAIGSDAPYQLAAFLVLLLLLRIYDRRLNETDPWKWGLLAGFSIACAYLIRPFGLAFLLAVAGFDLLKRHRPSTFLIATITALLPPIVLNNLLLHKDSSYSYQFTLAISPIVQHALAYIGFLSYIFVNTVSHAFRYVLWGVTLILALIAVIRRGRAALGLTELYVLVIFAVDCAFWQPFPRYLLSIFPVYMVYIFDGFQTLVTRVPQRFTLPIQVSAAVVLLLVPAVNAALLRPDASDTLITAPRYEQLCAEVRRQTAPDTLVIFWNPRVLAFSTGRRSSGWPSEGPPDRIVTYFRRVLPDYIVTDNSRPDDRRFLIPVVRDASLQLATVYQNDRFSLLRVLRR